MPIMPSTAMAKPTLRGGMPKPPVNLKGGDCCMWLGGRGFLGSKRGVDRWMNHRLLKVPICRARIPWQRSVQSTLRVQMREKGNLPICFFGGGGIILGSRDSSS